MTTKNIFKKLAAVVAGVVLLGSTAFAQANTDITLTVTSNTGGTRTLHFGVNTAATNGIDAGLSETSLPPFPPSGVFEARFVPDPDGVSPVLAGTEGSDRDYQPSTSGSQSNTHFMKVQGGTGGLPTTITWSASSVSSSYTGAVTLTLGNGSVINMKTAGTATVATSGQGGDIRIATNSPTAPPSGVSSSPCPLDFGTVQPSTVNNSTLTLTNNGVVSASVTGVTISNANYTVTSPSFPVSIAASGTQAVNVRFTAPATNGVQNGTITVTYNDGTVHTTTCSVTGNVSSGEGIFLVGGDVIDTVRDNSIGHTKEIGLRYSGGTPAQGVQFDLMIPNNLLKVTRVALGSAIANPMNWSFDYQITRAATQSQIRVVLYGNDTTINLPTNTDHLFVVTYDVANIRNCSGGPGGDDTTAMMFLSNVKSSLATNLGQSANIAADPNRDTANFYINNTSARGDVNCDDHVDVLDLLVINDYILGRTTLATWQINRADLAPWSAVWSNPSAIFNDNTNYGDGSVSVQDLVLITNAILNNKWPDSDPLARIMPADGGDGGTTGATTGAATKAANIYDVKFTYDISNTGINVDMNNLIGVKGIQMTLKAVDAPSDLAIKFNNSIETPFQVSSKVENGEIRIVAFTKNGEPIEPMSGTLMQLPFTISNPNVIAVIEPIIVGGPNNESLKVEYEVRAQSSSVNDEAVAKAFALKNMPNPFSGQTTIQYNLPKAAVVTLVVNDANGKEIARLVDGAHQGAGQHSSALDAAGLPSGTYFYTLTAGDLKTTQRMVLAR